MAFITIIAIKNSPTKLEEWRRNTRIGRGMHFSITTLKKRTANTSSLDFSHSENQKQ